MEVQNYLQLSYFKLFVSRIFIHVRLPPTFLVSICNMAEFPCTCKAVNSSHDMSCCVQTGGPREKGSRGKEKKDLVFLHLYLRRMPLGRPARRYPGRPSQLVCPAPTTSHSFPPPVIYGLLCRCGRTCVCAPSSSLA